MKISDKELDDLFGSKLNEFEVEPSEMVWNNLSEQINTKSKRKSIVPFLRIAASVIIVVSVGLMLLQKDAPIAKKPVKNKATKINIEQQKPLAAQKENTKPDEPMLLLSAKNKSVKEVRQNKTSNRKREIIPVQKIVPELKITDQMLTANHPAEEKNTPTVTILMAEKMAVVPDVSTRFNTKVSDDEVVTEVKPQILAAKNSTPPVAIKRKGIRNMGDLVNLVMAKVDKRQDKLIEFTNRDDGDESNVTGINLGIISIKKEK